MDSVFYVTKLKEELASRCERNPHYSIRAFSSALRVDAGTLSKVLAGKQIPTLKLINRLIKDLDLYPAERQQVLNSVSEARRTKDMVAIGTPQPEVKARDLSFDIYRVIAEWYHFAILELTYVEDFQSSPSWVAKELGLSTIEAKLAIERLIRVGLLKKSRGGKLLKTDEQLSSTDKHLTDPALKKNQRQFLGLAIDSLENDPIEARSMTSMTMAIDPARLPIAKQMIRRFNQELCRLLESGKRKRVYNLEIALYPLQKANSVTKEKSK